MTIFIINAVGWLILHMSIAAIATRLDARHFARDNCLYRVHPFEIRFYRRILRIRSWKHHLPDGALWVGGHLPKKDLRPSDPASMRQFVIETRRGEAAHWLMLACFPIFFLWNPPWACLVIMAYAVLANLPCILVQRYNREAAQRIGLHRDPP